MIQQIRNGRIERQRNQNQPFMYYRSPKIDYLQQPIYYSIRGNSGRIAPNNPERYNTQVYEKWSPLRGYYKVCSSLDQNTQRLQSLPKLPLRSSSKRMDSQQQTRGELDSQQILAERARQFINRLRKQRQYDHGKALIRKKKQEEYRKNKEKQEAKMRENYQKSIRQYKFNKMTDSILFHEERICERLRNSISRYRQSSLRSKTEEIPQRNLEKTNESPVTQFQQMDQSESRLEFSPVIALKSKYKN